MHITCNIMYPKTEVLLLPLYIFLIITDKKTYEKNNFY